MENIQTFTPGAFGLKPGSEEKARIIFQASDDIIQSTVVPSYSLVSVIESFGGFCVVVIILARVIVSLCEKSYLYADLIKNFYQVERLDPALTGNMIGVDMNHDKAG